MRVWCTNHVRARTFLSSFFNKSKLSVKQDAATLTQQQQENLKKAISSIRTDSPKSDSQVKYSSYYSKEIFDYHVDEDSIRARGFLKYRYNYRPPDDLENTIYKVVNEILCAETQGIANLDEFLLNDNNIKFKIISSLSEHFKHYPTNSRLMHIQCVKDLIDFYKEGVENITTYIKLARKNSKPRNVHMVEQAHRFHPEDVEAWHKGVTAFPGSGGSVLGLRNKRLLRQFQPKSEWFDYEDQTFDYTRPDKDMPWDPEIARRMDRYPNKKFDIRKKLFVQNL